MVWLDNWYRTDRWYTVFSKLIKCYKEYYRKSTGKNVIDVVIYGCFDNVCLHQLVIEADGKKYIASSDMKRISDVYDEIIPLLDKVPFYKGYIVKKSDLYGLMDIRGKEIIPCDYERLLPVSFYEIKDKDDGHVHHSNIALFEGFLPDSYMRDVFDIDGNRLFSGYIYPYLHIKEVEYTDPPVDSGGFGVITYETWKSIKFTNDTYYECDPMFGYHEFVYRINDFGDKYQLVLTKCRSDWEDDELPASEILLEKTEQLYFGKTYFDGEQKRENEFMSDSFFLTLQGLDYWEAHDKMPVDELYFLMKIKEKLLLSELNAILDLEIAKEADPDNNIYHYRQYEKEISLIRKEIEALFDELEELHCLNKLKQ